MPDQTIQQTRERILEATLRASVVLGGIAWVPGVWASIRGGIPEVVILSTSVYAALLGVTFAPGPSFRTRARVLLGILYVLALGLLLAVGPPGAGTLWLTAIPVLAGVLLGTRGAVRSLVVVGLTCGAMGVLVHFGRAGPLPGATLPGYTLEAWSATAGSLLFLSAVMAIAVGVMVDRLEKLAVSERQTRLDLQTSAEEQLQLEIRLRQAQKLEALGTLAGGIAHDFNNLLVPLVAGTEDARESLPEDSPVRVQLDDILRSASRGRDLVRRILTFSRGSSGTPEPVTVSELIDEVRRLLRPSLPASIEIETRIDAPEARVLADPGELHQVLMNLATNGYLAMGERSGALTFELDADDVDVWVRVRDTGVGMNPEVLQRARDPFFTTRAPEGGTGLGLSTVHGIVRSLGGRLTLDSEPGRGTTAEVRLLRHHGGPDAASGAARFSGADTAVGPTPNATEDATPNSISEATSNTTTSAAPKSISGAAPPPPDPPPQVSDRSGTVAEPPETAASTRILLVDDDDGVRMVTVRVLERFGYRVTAVSSAAAALDRLDRPTANSFDLLLTDQTMPEMSGLELLRHLRDRGSTLPTLLMSGYLSEEMRAEAAGLDAEVLAKPFQRTELLTAVTRAL